MPFMGFMMTRDTTRRETSFGANEVARRAYEHGMGVAWTQLGWGLLALTIPVLVTAFLWWRLRRLDAAGADPVPRADAS